MTFSIVARSADGESWGVAVASKFLAIGGVTPAAVAGVGAVATQADINTSWKFLGLAHLDDGATAQVALDRLVEEDDVRDQRQAGIVDSDGNAATYTGNACFGWAGGITGRTDAGAGFAIQGNILAGAGVVEAMDEAFRGAYDQPFSHQLLAALVAGEEAGGDVRGPQAAALLVVRDGAGYGGHDDTDVDLRVDDHTAPLDELARLLDLHEEIRAERIDRPDRREQA